MSNARLRRRYRNAPWYPFRDDAGLVAVDLGKRKVGVAVFDDTGVLRAAQTIHTQRDTRDWDPWLTADAVLDYAQDWAVGLSLEVDWVCEWPELRANDRHRHHNITALQQVGILIERSVPWAERYRPSEWKRSVGKSLHHERLKEALGWEDYELDVWSGLGHDARDAVGIGLFALGRTDVLGRAQ